MKSVLNDTHLTHLCRWYDFCYGIVTFIFVGTITPSQLTYITTRGLL